MVEKEIWKDVKGYDGIYQISSIGRVKSFYSGKGKILKGSIRYDGYLFYTLYFNSIPKTVSSHQLVTMAFLNHNPCGFKKVVNHIDGNKLNNDARNLEIVTNRENNSICHRINEATYSSIYVGVSWSKARRKWKSTIKIKGRNVHLGYYDIEQQAGNSYKEAVKNLENPKYFESIKPKFSSKYKNIYYNKSNGRWRAKYRKNGKQIYVGSYDTEEEAYNAQQLAISSKHPNTKQ